MSEQIEVKSSPGRPPAKSGDTVRADLLKAASNHFLTRDFKAVSLRQIASDAGVNPAMIKYYFGDKRGLYMSMVDQVTNTLEKSLQVLGDGRQIDIAEFSERYSQVLAENPWWPNFMIREVLYGEGEVRDAVLDKFSSKIVPGLMAAIQGEIGEGKYRRDLNPAMALISMLGMTIFPFLAKPVVEQVLKVSIDEKSAAQLARHNTQLFLHGVMSSDSAGDQQRDEIGDQT